AGAGVRTAADHDEPDPDQGRAQPARPGRRRLPAAARPAHRGRARARARLPRAPRAARRRVDQATADIRTGAARSASAHTVSETGTRPKGTASPARAREGPPAA